jgi:hypothetical protein
MKKILAVFCLLILIPAVRAQADCQMQLQSDTMTLTGEGKVLEGDYLEVTLKNQSEVRLFRTSQNKLYLRLIVTENFYFNKVDMLEIMSGSKSYYAKNTKQHKVSKTRGLFLIEIFHNYLATLKEDGITGLTFNKAVTDFTRQDANLVKAMAKCMYDNVTPKSRQ